MHHQKSSISKFSLILWVMSFLYVTTFSLPFKDAINLVQASDVYSYLVISNSAPFFPIEKISFHFAQRWVPHYLTGIFSGLLDNDLALAYNILNIIIIFLILILFLSSILKVVADRAMAVFIFLLLSLSVFTFRLYILVPGLFADLFFVCGLAFSIKGCMDKKYSYVILGMLLATTGKQFSLLILPGISLYFYCTWIKTEKKEKTLLLLSGLVLITLSFYALLAFIAENFSLSSPVKINIFFSFFSWIFSERFTYGLLAEHIFRIILPVSPFLIMIIIWPGNIKNRLEILNTSESISLILITLGPIAYAFFPGPEVQMGNQSRYIGLVLFPISLIIAKIFSATKLQLTNFDFFCLFFICMCHTYHHRYTVIQSTPAIFFAVQMTALVTFIMWSILRKNKFLIN